jgi:hypothetical protein
LRDVTLQTSAVTQESRWRALPWQEYVPVGLVGAAALLLYTLTACPWVLGGDNGEFALLAAAPGVPHPSGYPLYALYLRAMSWLPGITPAHTAALATALLGALTAWTAGWAAIRWGARPTAAAFAASLFAFARLPWQLSTSAEVFALHALLAAAILGMVAPGGRLRGLRRAAALGLLAGLGLANNHTLVLLAPTGIYGVMRAGREAQRPLLAFGVALLGFAVGLAPYAALPWLGDGALWGWANPQTLDDVLHHALRRDFGTFQFGIYEGDPQRALHLWLLASHLWIDALFLAVPASLLGLWIVFSRRLPGPERRVDLALWLVSFALAGPGLVLMMNRSPDGVARFVVERFYLLPQLMLVVPTALTFEWLSMRLRLTGARIWPVAVIVACLLIAAHLQRIHDHNRPTLEHYVTNTLEQLPADAVLLGTGDHRFFGYQYAQIGLGLRPDVVALDATQLTYPWYYDRACARFGAPLSGPASDGSRNFSTVALIEQLVASGRPVFLTDVYSDGVGRRVPMVPAGALLRVVPPGEPPKSIIEMHLETVNIFNRYLVETLFVPEAGTWDALVFEDYARPWHSLAESFDRIGDAATAARIREIESRFLPSQPTSALF